MTHSRVPVNTVDLNTFRSGEGRDVTGASLFMDNYICATKVDMGCGRGAMLLATAKRLPRGRRSFEDVVHHGHW
jgi:hypothetical protein